MKVFLRFYEELKHFLPTAQQKQPITLPLRQRSTVKDVIESLGIPHTEVDLILVNGESVSFDHLLQENDYVSVFPMFGSLDISSLNKLRSHPLRWSPPHGIKFVVDVNLGKLARTLRMMGFDVLFDRNLKDDEELAAISEREHRVLLTRDMGLLKRKNVTQGFYVRNHLPEKQLAEVIQRFDLRDQIELGVRCSECNTPVIAVPKEQILERLPPRVAANYNEFYLCPRCQKIYWKGTHFESMKKNLGHFASEQDI